jgi:hypothetical protein
MKKYKKDYRKNPEQEARHMVDSAIKQIKIFGGPTTIRCLEHEANLMRKYLAEKYPRYFKQIRFEIL